MTEELQQTPAPVPDVPLAQPSGVPQDTVNKLVGEARKSGRETAVKTLLEELGLESLDTLKALVGEVKTQRDKDMTEAQKLQAQLEQERKAKAELDSKVQALQSQFLNERKRTTFEAVAKSAGVKQADDLLILVKAKKQAEFDALFDDNGATTDDKMKAFLKDVQTVFPAFFGAQGAGSPSNSGGMSPTTLAQASDELQRELRKKFSI
jgi:hypothetical protein